MRVSAAWLCTLACLVSSATAFGNSAPPWTDGSPVGEPVTILQEVAIERETLSFDFAQLEEGLGRVAIEAIYKLDNQGQSISTPLTFITPDYRNVTVTLDGTPLPTTDVTDAQVPRNWNPPPHSPSLEPTNEDNEGDGYPIGYVSWTAERPETYPGFQFHVTLGPGSHLLTVRYAMVVPTYFDDHPYSFYQVGYVLAPARAWKSFGGLDLKISVDRSWRFASSIPTAWQDGAYRASFSGLPADTLAFTTHPPLDETRRWLTGILPMAALLASLLAGLLGARALAVPPRGKAPPGCAGNLLRAVLAAFFAAVVAMLIQLLAEWASVSLIEEHHAASGWLSRRSSTTFFLLSLSMPVIAAVSFFATFFFRWKTTRNT